MDQACRHQRKLPSEAALARLRIALQQVQELWAQRPARTLDSLDECLQWSPVRVARKPFLLAGWSWETLQALSAQDKELVSFCLLGQDGAHGTWQASQTRSAGASRHALAAALAPLGMQLAPWSSRCSFRSMSAAGPWCSSASWSRAMVSVFLRANGWRPAADGPRGSASGLECGGH
jgi:hypothetical protein